MTDGIWVWPGELPYYVKKYHIQLEPEFIKTMQKNEWTVTVSSQIDFDDVEIC